jgi:aspartyl-tRNA(Asn)/glutamyl-tRNA(Gln) amidotransferase subunit C
MGPLARLTHALDIEELPMAIDAATVRKVAKLARLAEPEERLEPLARELSAILSWIEQLGEVDTEGVEPMTTSVAMGLPMRDDVVTDGGDPAKVLANAPKRAGDFFVVPKVVE